MTGWTQNNYGGWRCETHYVGETWRGFWRVWVGTIDGGYAPVAGPFASAADAMAWADTQAVAA